ncbi:hypothetical protein L1887_30025 [Cichorium endivia]|nr:hypothetical protein L1887_30025 [Cichorium endivia]
MLTAGVVKRLVDFVVAAGEAADEQVAMGMAEKAMVVLSSSRQLLTTLLETLANQKLIKVPRICEIPLPHWKIRLLIRISGSSCISTFFFVGNQSSGLTGCQSAHGSRELSEHRENPRTHVPRLGQTKTVTMYRLICKETV